MNPLEVRTYIREKGYDCSKIYHVPGLDTPDVDFTAVDRDQAVYRILVFKDFPKSERMRKWFEGPTITELFYAVQGAL